jgi:hypothetical protein
MGSNSTEEGIQKVKENDGRKERREKMTEENSVGL